MTVPKVDTGESGSGVSPAISNLGAFLSLITGQTQTDSTSGGTTTTSKNISAQGIQQLMQQMLEANGGLADQMSGAHLAGMYGDTTSMLLAQNLATKIAGTAALESSSETKTTSPTTSTMKVQPKLTAQSGLESLALAGLSQAGSKIWKKLMGDNGTGSAGAVTPGSAGATPLGSVSAGTQDSPQIALQSDAAQQGTDLSTFAAPDVADTAASSIIDPQYYGDAGSADLGSSLGDVGSYLPDAIGTGVATDIGGDFLAGDVGDFLPFARGGRVPGYARGGVVRGSGPTTNNAPVTAPGMPKPATKAPRNMGPSPVILMLLNPNLAAPAKGIAGKATAKGGVQGFAKGGIVGLNQGTDTSDSVRARPVTDINDFGDARSRVAQVATSGPSAPGSPEGGGSGDVSGGATADNGAVETGDGSSMTAGQIASIGLGFASMALGNPLGLANVVSTVATGKSATSNLVNTVLNTIGLGADQTSSGQGAMSQTVDQAVAQSGKSGDDALSLGLDILGVGPNNNDQTATADQAVTDAQSVSVNGVASSDDAGDNGIGGIDPGDPGSGNETGTGGGVGETSGAGETSGGGFEGFGGYGGGDSGGGDGGGEGGGGESGFEAGGFISAPGDGSVDTRPIKVANGEFVINANAAKAIGYDKLNWLNTVLGGMNNG